MILLWCAAAPASAASFEVSGWIPYWRAAEGSADAKAHLATFTTLHPFAYNVQPDGSIVDDMGMDSAEVAALVAAAKAKKVRVIPTVIWHDTNAMHLTLSDPQRRTELAARITKLAYDNNFDGIDIDFEGKRAENKDHFSLFLKDFYARMGNKWVYCTIEPRTPPTSRYTKEPPAEAYIYANDYTAINKYCDRVNIMTYDQGTVDVKLNDQKGGAPYMPLADADWVEKVVRHAMQDIAKHKIVIGIPTYGYEYEMQPKITSYSYKMLWAFNPGYATDLAAQLELRARRNTAGEMSFTYLPSLNVSVNTSETSVIVPRAPTTTVPGVAAAILAFQPIRYVVWSDAGAIKQKVDIAKKLGVRGVAIFKIDGGEDPGIWSVLK